MSITTSGAKVKVIRVDFRQRPGPAKPKPVDIKVIGRQKGTERVTPPSFIVDQLKTLEGLTKEIEASRNETDLRVRFKIDHELVAPKETEKSEKPEISETTKLFHLKLQNYTSAIEAKLQDDEAKDNAEAEDNNVVEVAKSTSLDAPATEYDNAFEIVFHFMHTEQGIAVRSMQIEAHEEGVDILPSEEHYLL